MPTGDFRTRLGRAGLDALMRDPPLAARTPHTMTPDDTPTGAGGRGKRTAAARARGPAGRDAVIATGPGGSAGAIRAVAAGSGAAPARIRAAARLPPRGRVSREDWHNANRAIADKKDLTAHEQRILREIYAAEGGAKKDGTTGSTVFGGIGQRALDDIKSRPEFKDAFKDVNRPEDLKTPGRVVEAQRADLKIVTGRYGGPQALAKLKEPETAAALADAGFMHGGEGGAVAIKNGVNKLIADLPEEKRRELGLGTLSRDRGPKDTFEAIRRLDHAGMGEALRDKIADERAKVLESRPPRDQRR